MRILVVDDEPMVRFLLVRFLEEEGHSVDEAADGIEALEHLSRRAYDLLITDVHMPRMCGIDLVRALRRQGNAYSPNRDGQLPRPVYGERGRRGGVRHACEAL
jgi:CheY-like chemotaxis protein